MDGILNINLGDRVARCFINSGSFNTFSLSAYHKHSYAEIHIILDGEVMYHIGNTQLTTSSGSVVFIPSGTYHCAASASGKVCHSAIQIDNDSRIPCHKQISKAIVSEFFDELADSSITGNYAKLTPYINLICSKVINNLCESIEKNIDYAYAINEFFGRYYNKEITVSDLAAHLALSEKQTTRLVKKHTNKTFLQNLVEARMLTADYLSQNTDMSLSQIAQYVGYNSYGGFFKAREKHISEHISE